MKAHQVTIAHNFETAHRLPALGGKCTSLHGHSWWTRITVGAPQLSEQGTVVEFGALKAAVRSWIDTYLDHGTMLAATDPLCAPLQAHGSKLYRFGAIPPLAHGELHAVSLAYPTVEMVAQLLAIVTTALIAETYELHGAELTEVHVQETHVNAATWRPL